MSITTTEILKVYKALTGLDIENDTPETQIRVLELLKRTVESQLEALKGARYLEPIPEHKK